MMCFIEMCFDGTFASVDKGGDVFDTEFLNVSQEEYLFAHGWELYDGLPKDLLKFLLLKQLTRIGVGACDTPLINSIKGCDVVRCLLFSGMVGANVFSDVVYP